MPTSLYKGTLHLAFRSSPMSELSNNKQLKGTLLPERRTEGWRACVSLECLQQLRPVSVSTLKQLLLRVRGNVSKDVHSSLPSHSVVDAPWSLSTGPVSRRAFSPTAGKHPWVEIKERGRPEVK